VLPTGCPTSGISRDGRQLDEVLLEGGRSVPSIMGPSVEVLAYDRFAVPPVTHLLPSSVDVLPTQCRRRKIEALGVLGG
jgi:hypothetical protein